MEGQKKNAGITVSPASPQVGVQTGLPGSLTASVGNLAGGVRNATGSNDTERRQGPTTLSSNDSQLAGTSSLVVQQPRQRQSSISSVSSFKSASGGELLTLRSETQTIDNLTAQIRIILEKAKIIHEKTGVQKNVNKETKEGIKVITEAAEVALIECEAIKNLWAHRTTEPDMIRQTEQTPKRKRNATEGSPPEKQTKRPTGTRPETEWETATKKVRKKKTTQTTQETDDGNRNRNRPKRTPNKTLTKLSGSAVLVKPQEGKTYAELLKQIKENVDPTNENVTVKGFRKTRDGNLLIRFKTGIEGSRNFQQSIQNTVGTGARIRSVTPSISLEIMDLDCVTTADEVTQALKTEIGRDEDINVHIFGPNRAEQCMAVCQLEPNVAAVLLNKRRIRIGWTNCRIRQRTIVTRCYRCLNYGHTKKDCTGPDRTRNCWKCGKEGHIGKNCTNRPSCFLCSEAKQTDVTHLPGSGSCAIFRVALEECKKAEGK